ncbi:SprT-like family-domain-containing protein [Daldinia caldariorum]|uniref:SprT-like family-domain-containing protein n=1 Tax=Daldinia caldariorum TaxID=326644 RepID=UPI002008CC6A|nr:SprT-like family-domain-containing protein [Daldinia caldariorum]KAI1469432.1 SprT-like family-domain-containing protein [Daldinia caldariorum]
MLGGFADSSEDEFPEIDLVVSRYHKVSEKSKGKRDEAHREAERKAAKSIPQTECDVPSKSNPAVKATPLRRRKLGQGQIVDGSLLKPWDDTAIIRGKGSHTSKPTTTRAPVQKTSTKPKASSFDAPNSDILPTTARQAGSLTISSSTKPVLLPKARETYNEKSRQKDENKETRRISRKPAKKSIQSDESEEELEDVETSEEEVSEFVSISESESDTWNSDSEHSEHSSTPPPRRSKSPIAQWGRPQRKLFGDPGKKAAPSNKQPQATIANPSKRGSKQRDQGESILDYFKPSRSGNLEDAFQKLHIFNEDSDSDEPSSKRAKNPVLEPTTPKRAQKTLPASPLKTPRIPASPWKPEHKEFWDPEVNFAWIDEHSPEKPKTEVPEKATKAKKQPGETKRKPGASPAKQLRDARRAFDASKEDLARTFLCELDERVTKGQLGKLTRETGGLQIKWSNTLLTTAGRAHWKCRTESTTTRHADGTSSQGATTRKHHASIELASKVLGNEADLLNTVAHEFCHLAVFMLGGPNAEPRGMGERAKKPAAHGPEFKAWGARCGALFGGRGIQVTTKHNYEIEFKYIWRCGDCAIEVKRHSKSVDPERQRCGGCHGKLVQIKPVPRGAGAGAGAATKADAGATGGNSTEAGGNGNGSGSGNKKHGGAAAMPKKRSAWQEFMTKETRVLSQTNPGLSFKERMALISARWQEQQKKQNKTNNNTATTTNNNNNKGKQAVKELQSAVEILTIDDDEDDDDEGGKQDEEEEGEGEQKEVEEQDTDGKPYDIFA